MQEISGALRNRDELVDVNGAIPVGKRIIVGMLSGKAINLS